MSQITANPRLLKQANLSMIRKKIMEKGTATRAEIAEEIRISSTTVRSLLNDMIEHGEIESVGYDESSGGRKAERYRFKPECYHSAVFCISGNQIHALLVNACGEIMEQSVLETTEEEYEQAIIFCLDEMIKEHDIKAIGIGVPGVVDGGCYWKKYLDSDQLYRVDIGNVISERYHIPVVLENDLNATAIGIGRCYEKEFPDVSLERIHMAFLHFEKGCVSAGFIVEGRVVRGFHNFAGEIGLIPMGNDMPVDAYMAEPMADTQYIKLVTQMLSWICAILNPEYIALGGGDLRKECMGSISSLLSSLVPDKMMAEILYVEDIWHDYHSGMAYLTAGKIFDDVQFIKE